MLAALIVPLLAARQSEAESWRGRKQVVLNNLYKHTVLQTRFACNMVALVNGKPMLLDLKQFLSHFLEFR